MTRIKLRKPCEGIVDGVRLSQLVPGLTYDVDSSLAAYLIENDCAEEVPSSEPTFTVPLDNPRAYEILARGVIVIPAKGTQQIERRLNHVDRRKTLRGTPDRRQSPPPLPGPDALQP